MDVLDRYATDGDHLMQSELLRTGLKEQLAALLECASERVLISSPFVSRRGVDFLMESLSDSVREDGRVQVLANLSPQNIVQGSTEPEALHNLSDGISDVAVHHLPHLHAKVYVADTREAVVTSGNLTSGGLEKNYEYGVSTTDAEAISVICDDLLEYAELGVQVSEDELQTYIEVAENVRETFQAQQESRAKTACQNFEEALAEARDELVRLRLKGASTNATFAKTILYLLWKKGAMATEELHPHVQRIHPDLCDDSIDRVVNGENYGKRWKHRVRAAQSTLKQKGDIELRDGKWRLSGD